MTRHLHSGAWRIAAAIFLVPCVVFSLRAATAPVRIAAASDLQYALTEIAARYQRETGETVQLSFGSSGNFARQIVRGAPFQIFLSADESYVERLAAQGYTRDKGVNYARGRIVLFTSGDARIQPAWADLRAALVAGRLQHFAIPNPEHAPYGRAAREALTQAGLWTSLEKNLVLGENATQTAQFVFSGAAQAAILPYSLAIAPAAQGRGQFDLLPETMHAPLIQRMVLLRGADAGAQRFFTFLQQPPARAILQRYGFVL